jgi:hypothetical protein
LSTQELDKAKHYVRDLVIGSLFLTESKAVAQSLLLDYAETEWIRLIKEKNLLQKNSPNTAIRYARTIKRRLEPLGRPFIQAIIDANDPLYSQLLTLALLMYTPVVADFMAHVVAETKRVYKPNLASDAWDVFLHDRSRTLPGLYDLSDSATVLSALWSKQVIWTITKAVVYKLFICCQKPECGYSSLIEKTLNQSWNAPYESATKPARSHFGAYRQSAILKK